MTYIIIVLLVLLSGLFSGLTLGFLSLSKTDLERKKALGDKNAEKIYSVRKKGNLLLCTLLIGNVAVNSALSIFLAELDSLMSGFIAGVIATSLIVIFGEIIPQAIFSRYAMKIGAKFVWLVKIFIIIMFPIAAPIAWILDETLDEEIATIWSRAELEEIIKQHEDSSKSDIDESEERILLGALSFSKKRVEDIMTPRTVVLAYDEDTILDEKKLKEISEQGFSRIPIYKNNIDNISGLLFIKDLVGIEGNIKVCEVFKRGKYITVTINEKMNNLFETFKREKVHIAIVIDEFGGFEGVVTLEDIIEEILDVEIMDETDKIENLQLEAKKRAKNILNK